MNRNILCEDVKASYKEHGVKNGVASITDLLEL